MARNVEIKARIRDINFCVEKAEELSGGNPEIITQEDTFFNCENGRLKLRHLSDNSGVLIFYKRPDVSGPKLSEYQITSTHEPDNLLNVLEKSYGSIGKVKKSRRLYIIGRTRIHLDQVDKLGDFIEFEVALKENESIIDAEKEANELLNIFNILKEDLSNTAYVDMIEENL